MREYVERESLLPGKVSRLFPEGEKYFYIFPLPADGDFVTAEQQKSLQRS
jgi:hypothetical protein